jgi:hypothetical protein
VVKRTFFPEDDLRFDGILFYDVIQRVKLIAKAFEKKERVDKTQPKEKTFIQTVS